MGVMKKRWISLYVENQVGVLSKISGLFSAKSYNLESLTVGTTEDSTVSRMTIGVNSDDVTYEQIKKQLNRMVEVIKVIDLEFIPAHMKELLYARINNCKPDKMTELFHIAQAFDVKVVDIGIDTAILESVQTEARNNELVELLKIKFKSIDIVRGGNVEIESISITDR